MKKLLSVLVSVLVLVSVFAISASAANVSPEGKPVISKPVKVETDIGGKKVDLIVKDLHTFFSAGSLTSAQESVVEELIADLEGENSTEVQKYLVTTYAGVTDAEIAYSNTVEISLPEGTEMPAEGMELTITDSSIKAGDTVVLLLLNEEGVWEEVKVTAIDGGIVGTFTSLAPVYYFTIDETGAANNSDEAPPTGDFAPVVAIVTLGAVATAFVAKKRLVA